MAYSFPAAVTSRGYHVYKDTFWTNAKVGEKVTVETETKKSLLEVNPTRVPLKLEKQPPEVFFEKRCS